MLSPHEFSMLLRVARAPDSVDPSNPAFAVLVESGWSTIRRYA